MSVFYLVIAVASFFFFTRPTVGILCLIFSILWILFYPSFYKHAVKKRYLGQLRERYICRYDDEMTLVVTDAGIEISTADLQGRIKYSAVMSLVELKDHFLVRLKNSEWYIIPKGPTKGDELSVVVKTIAENAKVEILDAIDWKWK